jgi:NDP-sugar pyrophosphorylase family protein
LIHYALLMLRRAGITQVAINLHHLAASIENRLGDGSAFGMSITYAPEPVLLGTGGPLPGLRGFFGMEPFVLINSDTILDLDLSAVISFHNTRRALATFVVRPAGKASAYSELMVDAGGALVAMRLLAGRSAGRFDEYRLPAVSDDARGPQPYMFCGVTVCEPSALDLPMPSPPFSLMGDLFAPALAAGKLLAGFVHRGYFRTVDDLAAYGELQREMAAAAPRLSYLD